MNSVVGWARLLIGLIVMAIGAVVWMCITLVLLPWRILRIKACNYFGHIVSGFMVWLSGCQVTVRGKEHLDPARPAIYISNHTSIMDIFLGSWLSPVGTVGIAKKEVIYYPFFGQLYLLSGHLRIDRSSPRKAVRSMQELGRFVRDHGLSIFLWPEGTRSRDGRLLPFKKGTIHLAMQTGLPVVPMVVAGADKAWEADSLRISPVPIEISVLPAVDTSDWSRKTIDDHVAELEALFAQTLPDSQQPKAIEAAAEEPAAAAR